MIAAIRQQPPDPADQDNQLDAERATKTPRARVRSCVGCGSRTDPEQMLRFILTPEDGVVADLAGSGFGRGAWVHARGECLRTAATRGFARSFKRPVKCNPEKLQSELGLAAERRLTGLLSAAFRARKLVYGGQAVADGLTQVILGVLSEDARAIAKEPQVAQLAASGRLVLWGTKARLGEMLGRGEVALLGITDHGLARAVAFTISLTQLSLQPSASPLVGGKQSNKVPEVR